MNKLFLRIATAFAGMAMAIGVGVVAGNKADVKAANAGTATKTITVSDVVGNNYKAYSTSDALVTFGGGSNAAGTNNTNFNSCNLGSYTKYAVSPVSTSDTAFAIAFLESTSNVTGINFTSTDGTNGNKGKIYVLHSTNNTSFSQITLTTGTQGATLANATNKNFAFSSLNGYFAVVIKGSNFTTTPANFKYTGVTVTLTYDNGSSDPSVDSVTLDVHSAELMEDDTIDLDETVSVSNGAAQTVSWTTSDANVATVDSDGVVTAEGAGTATITCASTVAGFTNVKDTCSITVYAPDNQTEITFKKEGLINSYANGTALTSVDRDNFGITLSKGTGSNDPAYYADSGVRLYKDNTFTISATSGKLKKITFTITAAANIASDDELYDSSTKMWSNLSGDTEIAFSVSAATRISYLSVEFVTAEPSVESVTLDKHLATLFLAGTTTITLTPTVVVSNGAAQTVSWTSSDPLIASVVGGVVTAEAAGTATITCASTVAGFTSVNDTCTVRVFDAVDGADEISFAKMNYADTEVISGKTIEKTNFSLQFVKNDGGDAKYYVSNTTARVYTGNTIVISSATKTIKKISFAFPSGGGASNLSASVGYYDSTNKRWTGTASSVTFTATGNAQISHVEVEYVSTDPIQAFIDTYLYMDDARFAGEGTGVCSSEGLYLAAKAALNDLTPAQISSFESDEGDLYTAALARYNAWAVYCNDGAPFDGNDTIVTPLRTTSQIANAISDDNSPMLAIVAIVSTFSLLAVGGYFFLRRKQH